MSDPAFQGAVMWYGVAQLPRLRTLSFAQLQVITQACSDVCQQNPLHLTGKQTFLIQEWDEKPLTGGQIIALMVFGLWVMLGEKEELCSGLVEAWPIREAVLMANLLSPVPQQ